MEELVLSCRLKELRKKNRYTQAFVSSQLNIGRATYSNYELGKRMPSLDIVVDFAKFYHVSLSYLLFPKEQDFVAATEEKAEDPFTNDEILLLDQYRALSTAKKQEVLDFTAFLKTRP